MKACSGALDLGTGRTSRWGIQSKPNAIRCQAEHYSVVTPNGIPRLKANTFPDGRFLVHVRTISIGTATHLTGLFGKEYSRLRTLFLKRYMPP